MDDFVDLLSKLLTYLSSTFAAFFAFIETHHNGVGLVLSGIGIAGGLYLKWRHDQRMERLREIEISRGLES